jgi:hypothetical protein
LWPILFWKISFLPISFHLPPLFNGISQLTGNFTNSPIPPLFQLRLHGKGRKKRGKDQSNLIQSPIPFSFFPSSAAKAAANFTAMNLADDGNWNGEKPINGGANLLFFQPIKGFLGC